MFDAPIGTPTEANVRSDSDSLVRILVGIAAVGVILVTLNIAAQVVNMLLLGSVLAICFAPVMDWFIRRGLGRGTSMILTSVIMVIGGFALLIFISLSFARLVLTLPEYQEDLATRLEELDALPGVNELLGSTQISTEQLASFVLGFVARSASTIYLLGFTMIVGVFALWERILLPEKVRHYLGAQGRTVAAVNTLAADIFRFVTITAKTNLISATGDTILLIVLGVDFALLWGILSFILGFIPSVGFLLSLIPPLTMAFVQFGWQAALVVLLGYWVINGVTDNFIKPKFIGVGLDLSPMVVFFSLIVWGWALGLIGALLSVPLTLIVYRFILQPLASTRWVADMMRYGLESELESDSAPAADTEQP